MSIVTAQLPVPGQLNPASALLQPVNVAPAEAAALSVTVAFLLKSVGPELEHVSSQLMPAGVLVTVPVAPASEVFCTVSGSRVDVGPDRRA